MPDIHPIYYNDIGINFQWKDNKRKDLSGIQMVFRDRGCLHTKYELKKFSKNVKNSLDNVHLCKDCPDGDSFRALLLDTSVDQISLVMSKKELLELRVLVAGTLFELRLAQLLDL